MQFSKEWPECHLRHTPVFVISYLFHNEKGKSYMSTAFRENAVQRAKQGIFHLPLGIRFPWPHRHN